MITHISQPLQNATKDKNTALTSSPRTLKSSWEDKGLVDAVEEKYPLCGLKCGNTAITNFQS